MSYILNALRKSELQRQQGQSETLENKIILNDKQSGKKLSIWIIILVFINVLFLGYFVWSLTDQKTKTFVEQEKKAAIKPQQVIVVVPEYKAAQNNTQVVEVDKKHTVSIAERIKQKQSKKQQSRVLPNIQKQQKKPVLNKQDDIINIKQNVVSKLEVLPIDSIKQVVEVKKNNKQDIPFLFELSQQFRRNIPSININVFVYSDNKPDRFIMVNMRKFKVGQTIAEGMILNEIRKDSIVVEFKNRIFQINRQ